MSKVVDTMGNANDEELRLQAGIVSLYTPWISVGYRNPGVGDISPAPANSSGFALLWVPGARLRWVNVVGIPSEHSGELRFGMHLN